MSSKCQKQQYGILAIAPYTTNHCITSEEMQKNGLNPSRFMQKAVSVWDVNEDAISMALSATKKLLQIMESNGIDFCLIGRIEVGSESNVDMAKSIKSYILQLFPSNMEIEGADNVSACYGGTAALLNTLSWLRGCSKRSYGIVIATDTATMDKNDMCWQGCGAVAMLVGPDPAIEIHRERVTFMKNTFDFFQPRFSPQLSPLLDGQQSMTEYIEALHYTSTKMKERYGISLATVDHVAVHGGLHKAVIVRAMNEWSKWEDSLSQSTTVQKYECSTRHGELVGALYTASLYFNLHSVLEHSTRTMDYSMMLFSFGSGCASTMLSATVKRKPIGFEPLSEHLLARRQLSYAQTCDVTKRHLSKLTPAGILQADLLPLKHGSFHRAPDYDASKRYFLCEETSVDRCDEMSGLFLRLNSSPPSVTGGAVSRDSSPFTTGEKFASLQKWKPLVGICEYFQDLIGMLQDDVPRNEDTLAEVTKEMVSTISRLELTANELLGIDSALSSSDRLEVSALLTKAFRHVCCTLGTLVPRMITKPRGYAGDYLTIELIYNYEPTDLTPLGLAIDRAFLSLGAAKAVQNRRTFLTSEIHSTLARAKGRAAEVTSLAAGPAREVYDLFAQNTGRIDITCHLVDIDKEALNFVRKWRDEELKIDPARVSLHQKNLIHISLGSEELDLPQQDLIYSAGFADYFDDNMLRKILDYIYERLRPGGRVVIGNFSTGNPTRVIMDTILDWKLIHRDENDMHRLFESSKFGRGCTKVTIDQEGIQIMACCEK